MIDIFTLVFMIATAVFLFLHAREGWRNYKESATYEEPVFKELFQTVSIRDATIVGIDLFYLVIIGLGAILPALAESEWWTPAIIGTYIPGRIFLYLKQRNILAVDVDLDRRGKMLRYGYVLAIVAAAVSVSALLFTAAQPPQPSFSYNETYVEPVTPQVKAGEFLIVPIAGFTQSQEALNEISRTIQCDSVIKVSDDLSYRWFYEQPFITSPSGPSIPGPEEEPAAFDFNLGVLIPEEAPAGNCTYTHMVNQDEAGVIGILVSFEIVED